jgi:hypothetical protein
MPSGRLIPPASDSNYCAKSVPGLGRLALNFGNLAIILDWDVSLEKKFSEAGADLVTQKTFLGNNFSVFLKPTESNIVLTAF